MARNKNLQSKGPFSFFPQKKEMEIAVERWSEEECLASINERDWETRWSLNHWNVIEKCCFSGYLHLLLQKIPQSNWGNKSPYTNLSILHHACYKDNGNAFISLLKIVDVNKAAMFCKEPWYPIQAAANNGIAKNVELILAAGFNTSLAGLESPISLCDNDDQCIIVLVSNLYRLKQKHLVKSLALKLEKSVVQCRDVIVTLLGLKKFRRLLPKLDRFLIQQELTVAIWTTRSASLL